MFAPSRLMMALFYAMVFAVVSWFMATGYGASPHTAKLIAAIAALFGAFTDIVTREYDAREKARKSREEAERKAAEERRKLKEELRQELKAEILNELQRDQIYSQASTAPPLSG